MDGGRVRDKDVKRRRMADNGWQTARFYGINGQNSRLKNVDNRVLHNT